MHKVTERMAMRAEQHAAEVAAARRVVEASRHRTAELFRGDIVTDGKRVGRVAYVLSSTPAAHVDWWKAAHSTEPLSALRRA